MTRWLLIINVAQYIKLSLMQTSVPFLTFFESTRKNLPQFYSLQGWKVHFVWLCWFKKDIFTSTRFNRQCFCINIKIDVLIVSYTFFRGPEKSIRCTADVRYWGIKYSAAILLVNWWLHHLIRLENHLCFHYIDMCQFFICLDETYVFLKKSTKRFGRDESTKWWNGSLSHQWEK